jgi:hypothetical protein
MSPVRCLSLLLAIVLSAPSTAGAWGFEAHKFRLSQGVLDADKTAAEGREFYDDAYFTAFERGALAVLEQRVNESITAVASIIIGAWQQAGRPTVPIEPQRTPRRIRRPNP